MQDIVTWLMVGGGAGSIVTWIANALFIKPALKIKNTEAKTAEFDSLKKEIDYANSRIDSILKDLGIAEEKEKTARKEKDISEIKRYNLKNCISRAHGCSKRDCCPVLARQRELEDEWIKRSEEIENYKSKDNEVLHA